MQNSWSLEKCVVVYNRKPLLISGIWYQRPILVSEPKLFLPTLFFHFLGGYKLLCFEKLEMEHRSSKITWNILIFFSKFGFRGPIMMKKLPILLYDFIFWNVILTIYSIRPDCFGHFVFQFQYLAGQNQNTDLGCWLMCGSFWTIQNKVSSLQRPKSVNLKVAHCEVYYSITWQKVE